MKSFSLVDYKTILRCPTRVVLASFFFVLSAQLLEAKVWYVKPTGNNANSGLSWNLALEGVQAAINLAAAGDTVWVAQGTYKPTSTADRSISFVIKSGIAIFGGFAGDETALDQRDWVLNMTILSGDLIGRQAGLIIRCTVDW